MKKYLILLCYAISLPALSQGFEGIGSWQDHLPHKRSIAITNFNNTIYVATTNSIFRFNSSNQSTTRYTKVSGLSDLEVSAMNSNGEVIIVGYKNGNIDIINNGIINVPDIKNEPIIGEKKINNITFKGDFAYLSCSFGVVELNLLNLEVSNTFFLNSNNNLGVNNTVFFNDSVFAATEVGLYGAYENANLSDFHNWSMILDSALPISSLGVDETTLYLTSNDTLYACLEKGLTPIYTINPTSSTLKNKSGKLFLLLPGEVYSISGGVINSEYLNPSIDWVTDITLTGDTAWFSDLALGLVKNHESTWDNFYPSGPRTSNSFSLAVDENTIWIASGGIDGWNNASLNQGVYWTKGLAWNYLSSSYIGAKDIVNVVINPTNYNEVFLSTWNDGIIQLNWSEENQWFTKTNTFNQENTMGHLATLNPDSGDVTSGWIRVKSIAFDSDGNLWGANSQVNNALFVRRSNGEWDSYNLQSVNTNDTHLGNLLIDNYNQKWIAVPGGIGLVVWQNGESKILNSALGNGALASNSIYSLSNDLNGEVWVGTNNGVSVFYNPENIFSNNNFDSQKILVEVDGYFEYLLSDQTVTAIAVDGANRKWLGTDGSGVYLVSEDGTDLIYHFTEINSPLFSNQINDIAVRKESGEVFISTSKGVLSFVSGAIQGFDMHQNVTVYPNPVRPEHLGVVAVKGLVRNANVKITDVNGRLIYSTVALGGQAIWDGKNKFGKRVPTGVYLVFSTNLEGTESNVAKFLYIH